MQRAHLSAHLALALLLLVPATAWANPGPDMRIAGWYAIAGLSQAGLAALVAIFALVRKAWGSLGLSLLAGAIAFLAVPWAVAFDNEESALTLWAQAVAGALLIVALGIIVRRSRGIARVIGLVIAAAWLVGFGPAFLWTSRLYLYYWEMRAEAEAAQEITGNAPAMWQAHLVAGGGNEVSEPPCKATTVLPLLPPRCRSFLRDGTGAVHVAEGRRATLLDPVITPAELETIGRQTRTSSMD
jgi:hypothetical protein